MGFNQDESETSRQTNIYTDRKGIQDSLRYKSISQLMLMRFKE